MTAPSTTTRNLQGETVRIRMFVSFLRQLPARRAKLRVHDQRTPLAPMAIGLECRVEDYVTAGLSPISSLNQESRWGPQGHPASLPFCPPLFYGTRLSELSQEARGAYR